MYQVRRVVLISLMLFSFVALFTGIATPVLAASQNTSHHGLASVPQEAFASPSFSMRETWNGAGTPNSGGTFPMYLYITVSNRSTFYGTLIEGPQGRQSSAVISGYFGSGEFAPYGAVYFTTYRPASGNICLGCRYSAAFESPDLRRMVGNWYPPTGNLPAGSFELARVG